jgi:hypothetical protein
MHQFNDRGGALRWMVNFSFLPNAPYTLLLPEI